ncbi:hypothetical protein V1277_002948 [Bradyrhizobium sp. AZCC 1588]|uniref:hypothetical protein n=1 Tax=unclassified Bradyrhizobium TaxID=2631580 RepID=UPI002FF0C4FA
MKAEGFKTIFVDCVGPPDGDPSERCWHSSAVKLDDLPEWQNRQTLDPTTARHLAAFRLQPTTGVRLQRRHPYSRAFSVLIESKPGSRFLFCRVFLT